MSSNPPRRSRRWIAGAAAVAALGVSSVALGLPWDIDMADTQAVKAYAQRMPDLPEGVVAQSNLLSPKDYTTNAVRGSADAATLLAPVATDERKQLGEKMYGIYCAPCHGADGVKLGPVAASEGAPDRMPGVLALAGPNGVAQLRDDSWIYLTIRNGGAVMPAYGHTMSDEEMWAIVHFVRTLPGAAYGTPEPAVDEDAAEGEEEANP
ncbi:MAG: cytochrome c [Myxococcales bacterium]|nr:cytochrome c [Myxococcales bacterium]